MASTVTVVTTSAGTIDLTDTATNPDASPVATPRQGGFVIRNRWDCSKLSTANKSLFATTDWSSVGSSADASLAANQIHVLKVPKRTNVGKINVYAVEGKTQPDAAAYFSGSAGSTVSLSKDLNDVDIGIYSRGYISASQSTLAAKVQMAEMNTEDPDQGSSDTHGTWSGSQLTVSWSSLSVPTQAGQQLGLNPDVATALWDAGTWTVDAYMPHGGFVDFTTCNISADSISASAAKWSHIMTGVWEIQAVCNYVPE